MNTTKARVAKHYNQAKIKAHMRKMIDNEMGIKREARSVLDNSLDSNIEVDPNTNLPYGLGYDDIIKAEGAGGDDISRVRNDRAVDTLVQKLGYMDYRDALACNRYIIEARVSSDYH